MIGWVKRSLVELVVGAAVGFGGWCLWGKHLTSMLFGSVGGSFTCKADVEAALDKFVSMQLYSAIGGALMVWVGMMLLRRVINKARTQPTRPSPATGSASL